MNINGITVPVKNFTLNFTILFIVKNCNVYQFFYIKFYYQILFPVIGHKLDLQI